MIDLFDQRIKFSQTPHRRLNVLGITLHWDSFKYSKDVLTQVELMEIVVILLEDG